MYSDTTRRATSYTQYQSTLDQSGITLQPETDTTRFNISDIQSCRLIWGKYKNLDQRKAACKS